MHIRNISKVLLLSFILFSCKSKKVINPSCKGKIELQTEWLEKDKEDKEHLITKHLGQGFSIHFVGNYDNDKLNIFLNDHQFQKINIEGTAESYACVFSAQKPNIPIVKIESANKAQCISIKMDWKYPIVYVWFENEKWIVRYSNFYHSDNLNRI